MPAGHRQVDVLLLAVVQRDNRFTTGHPIAGLFQMQAAGAVSRGGEDQPASPSGERFECLACVGELSGGDIDAVGRPDLLGQAVAEGIDPDESFAAEPGLGGTDRGGVACRLLP